MWASSIVCVYSGWVGIASVSDKCGPVDAMDEKLDHLTDPDRSHIREMLQQYSDVFTHSETQTLPCRSVVKHAINTGTSASN